MKSLSLIISYTIIISFSINAQENINTATTNSYKNKPIAKYEGWGIKTDIDELTKYLKTQNQIIIENDKVFINEFQKLQLKNSQLLLQLKNTPNFKNHNGTK